MVMASGDYLGPFCQTTIIQPDGERVPLWMNSASNSRGDLPFVNEVNVKMQLAGVPIISAKLCLPIEEGRRFLDSTLVAWGGGPGGGPELEVILGYARGPNGRPVFTAPAYRGLLLKPEVTIGADITITLQAQGVNTSPLTTTSGRTLTGYRSDIIRQILRGYDPDNPRRTTVDDDEVRRAGDDLQHQYFGERIEVSCGRRTDWAIIHELLWEIGCWTLWLNDGLKVMPRTLRLATPPKYLLACYDFPSGMIGEGDPPVLPLKSATSPTMGVYIVAAVASGFVSTGINTQTRQSETRTTTERSATPARTGAGAAGPPVSHQAPGAGADGSGMEFMPGTPADQLTRNQAQQEFTAMQSQAGRKLSAETLGVIDLFPGDILGVRGLGRRVDTEYAVLTMNQNVSTTGFTTKVEMVSNVDTIVTETSRRVLGPTNRHHPPLPSLFASDAGSRSEAPAARRQPATRSRTAAAARAPQPPTQAPGTLSDASYNEMVSGLELRGL